MTVLIDTSVWVDHFRHGNDALRGLLEMDVALTHPMVLGELACGTPPSPRAQTLSDIGLIQSANQASPDEVMEFIEREQVCELGCGFVSISLLTSTLAWLAGCISPMSLSVCARGEGGVPHASSPRTIG